MRQIHPTALIERGVELADDVVVGAYTIIKAGVVVGAGCVIQEHCHIHGNTIIGARANIGPAAYVGLPPQHLKHDGKGTFLVIGDDVMIREMASAHRSISPGIENATRIGNRVMMMAASHVGHDCQIGDDVILANGVLLGGHVRAGNNVFFGGGATIHQFVRIGRLAIVAGNEALTHDIPPFAAVRYGGLKGYNAIGCKRSGMTQQSSTAVRRAYHCLHRNRTIPAAVAAIRSNGIQCPEVEELLTFIATSKRGVLASKAFRNGEHPISEE